MAGTSRSGGNRTSSDDNFPQTGLPEMPKEFRRRGSEEGKIWKRLMGEIPAELLRKIDAYQIRVLCSLIAREATLATQCQMDPADLQMNRAHLAVVSQIARLSAMFGLSPIDRRRIRMRPPEVQSDADEWAAG